MSAVPPLVGVINAGSSSVKCGVFEGERRLLSCVIDGIGLRARAKARDAAGAELPPPALQPEPAAPGDVIPALLRWLDAQLGTRKLAAIGHRVVHGGTAHTRPERVTPALIAELEVLVPLAPLHQPHNLAPIRAVAAAAPSLPQVACFDTAFHRTMDQVVETFALPAAMYDRGIRRYGFHGLSYDYIASVLPTVSPRLAAGRTVVLHLGNGASACAIRAGASVATSMGFSTVDGLPMGTRCGEMDAGLVLHFLLREGMTPSEVETLLYKQSGMIGLSGGLSSDFRDLLESPDPRAAFAVRVFCDRAARQVASLATAMGGLDGVVFTAGIGEHAAPVREGVCRALAWLGLDLDADANAGNGPRLSQAGSRIEAWVIPTDEERLIARRTAALAFG